MCLCITMQLQFYALLSGSDSELRKSIPSIIASGLVLPNGKGYKVIPWDESAECLAGIDARNIGKKRQRGEVKFDKSRCRTKWSEAEFARVLIGENNDDNENSLLENNAQESVVAQDLILWPFLVQKRCEGTNLDRVYVSLPSLLYHVLLFRLVGSILRFACYDD